MVLLKPCQQTTWPLLKSHDIDQQYFHILPLTRPDETWRTGCAQVFKKENQFSQAGQGSCVNFCACSFVRKPPEFRYNKCIQVRVHSYKCVKIWITRVNTSTLTFAPECIRVVVTIVWIPGIIIPCFLYCCKMLGWLSDIEQWRDMHSSKTGSAHCCWCARLSLPSASGLVWQTRMCPVWHSLDAARVGEWIKLEYRSIARVRGEVPCPRVGKSSCYH